MDNSYQLRELKIELTQECPLACIHCSTSSSRKQLTQLPLAQVLRILHEGSELGVRKVAFTGGEPLVYTGLQEAVKRARELDIAVTLYTSGIKDNDLNSLTTDEAASLVNLGVGRFVFSLYGTDPKVHESVTRYGTFKATASALLSTVEAKGSTEIHCVAMRRNYRQIPSLVAKAAEWGVAQVSILRFVPQGRGRVIAPSEELLPHELEELAEIVRVCRRCFPKVGIRVGSPFNILLVGHSPCNAAQDILVINHKGKVFPCDAFKNVDYPDTFGSVLDLPTQTVWDRSSFLNRVRAELASGAGETCQGCESFATCKSGCLAQKVIRKGWGKRNPDPSCLVQIGNGVQQDRLSEVGRQSTLVRLM